MGVQDFSKIFFQLVFETIFSLFSETKAFFVLIGDFLFQLPDLHEETHICPHLCIFQIAKIYRACFCGFLWKQLAQCFSYVFDIAGGSLKFVHCGFF